MSSRRVARARGAQASGDRLAHPSLTGAIAARHESDGIVNEARIALEHQARELQWMAEDILDVKVFEARKFRLDLSDVDLSKLVTDVARDIGRGQVHLVLQAEPVIVEGDADRLRVMIGHLIGNAVRYSPAGSPILVTVASGHAEARIVVKDTGVGLAPADLTVLFQTHGQTPTAKTTGAQGVGLGLYVTQLLAEAHGGRVSAESVGPAGARHCSSCCRSVDRRAPPSPTFVGALRSVAPVGRR
jgi:signal transduction histidine kinase